MLRQLPREESIAAPRPTLAPTTTREVTPQPRRPGWRERWRSLVTENPIFHAERRLMVDTSSLNEATRTRMRRSWERESQRGRSPLQRLAGHLLGMGMGLILGCLALHYFRDTPQILFSFVGPFLGGALAVQLPAKAITRERERGTWDALLMSQMTPAQILGGKWAAHLNVQLASLGFLASFGLATLLYGWISWGQLALILAVAASATTLSTLLALDASLRRTSSARAVSLAMWRAGGVALAAAASIVASVVALKGFGPATLLALPALFFATSAWVGARFWRAMLLDFRRPPEGNI